MKKYKKYFLVAGVLAVVIIAATVAVDLHNNRVQPGAIQGTVQLGPTCPVERIPPDPGCASKPYAVQLELVDDAAVTHPRIIKKFSSTKSGTFLVKVAPGNYRIVSQSSFNGQPTGGLPNCSSQQSITVTAGQTSQVSVSCDTGIR